MKRIKIIDGVKYEIQYNPISAIIRIAFVISLILGLFLVSKMVYFKYINPGEFYDNSKNLIGNLNITENDDKNYLRLYNFSCIDCPLLEIYLSETIVFNKEKSVLVGNVKRPIGYQEYELKNISLDKYNKIFFWYKEKGEIYGKSYF